jgi:hypothetical protein
VKKGRGVFVPTEENESNKKRQKRKRPKRARYEGGKKEVE